MLIQVPKEARSCGVLERSSSTVQFFKKLGEEVRFVAIDHRASARGGWISESSGYSLPLLFQRMPESSSREKGLENEEDRHGDLHRSCRRGQERGGMSPSFGRSKIHGEGLQEVASTYRTTSSALVPGTGLGEASSFL